MKQIENEINRLESLMKNCTGVDTEIFNTFITHLEQNKNSIKRKSPESFTLMARDRSAAKFYGWTREQFDSHIQKLEADFKRSQEMTEEEFARIEQINRRAVTARLATQQKKLAN